MSVSGTPDLLLAPDVAFDVERFDWAGDDRLEVVGRWTGVRGLRFVRPVLSVAVAGRRRRLIAVLDHKPWEATDGGEWVAAFPWDGARDDVGPAQLAVGPNLVVDLPPPGPPGSAPETRRPSPAEAALLRAEHAEARLAREAEAAQALIRREREEHERQRRELHDTAEALRDDVAAARAVADGLRLELSAAQARLEDALGELRGRAAAQDDLRRELEALRAAAAQREHALAIERNEAVAERDRLAAARDAALELAESVDVTEERDRLARELERERERARELERRLAAPRTPAPPQDPAPTVRRIPREPAPEGESVRRIPREPAPDDDSAGRSVPGAAPRPAPPGAGPRPNRVRRRAQPEVKPLLVQAEPLRRSAAAIWARRVAIALVVVIVVAAVIIALRTLI